MRELVVTDPATGETVGRFPASAAGPLVDAGQRQIVDRHVREAVEAGAELRGGGAPGGAASPHGASGDGFGYGPEVLDELTRVRVVHQKPPPG